MVCLFVLFSHFLSPVTVSQAKNSDAAKHPNCRILSQYEPSNWWRVGGDMGGHEKKGDEMGGVEKMENEERGEKRWEQRGKEKGTLWLSEKADRENSVHGNRTKCKTQIGRGRLRVPLNLTASNYVCVNVCTGERVRVCACARLCVGACVYVLTGNVR